MSNSQDNELIFEKYKTQIINEGIGDLVVSGAQGVKRLMGGTPSAPTKQLTLPSSKMPLANTPQSRALTTSPTKRATEFDEIIPPNRSLTTTNPASKKVIDIDATKIAPRSPKWKKLAAAGAVAAGLGAIPTAFGDGDVFPPTPIKDKGSIKSLRSKPSATSMQQSKSVSTPAAEPAKRSFFSRFKSPDREMRTYGSTGAQLPGDKPKSSIKPLFSKGGLFNR
jgi:hypothetical protein